MTNSLDRVVAGVIDALSEAVPAHEVEVEFANWEYHDSDDAPRNYRGEYNELIPAAEHALRRGANLELRLRIQLGDVHEYPELQAQVIAHRDREQRRRELQAQADIDKKHIDDVLARELANLS